MNREIQWPVVGDRAFKIEVRSWGNAEIEQHPTRRLHLMAVGYKLISDQAIETVLASKNSYTRDTMVYPIFFNYRHFLEISLKAFVDEFASEAGVSVGKKNHQLLPIWNKYRSIVDEIAGSEIDKSADMAVASVIKEFDKFDPNSFAMRYSTDMKGNQIELPHAAFGLQGLKEVMERVSIFFDGTAGYISELVAAPDY